ncbi:MAG: argininosuccinate lyase [Eubacteriales bacterium]
MKLWAGRFHKELDSRVNDFNSSVSFDCRMYREDIEGSIAHADMLGECGIIGRDEAQKIIWALKQIRLDIDNGVLIIDPEAEDIHMFIEQTLTARIGDTGKRLHTARSRNDQVALDIRLYLRRETDEIKMLVLRLLSALSEKAKTNINVIMPGYTHLQRAQPVTYAHYLMAYAAMLMRDSERLDDCRRRMNVMPLGSGALASTTYPIDRERVRLSLGFDSVTMNSMDGVSDRDFVIELLSCMSVLMMHLSRFSEEIILWCSSEFAFIELDDAYSTGSSIMPQKKNPDVAELVRGKTGRVYGSLMTLLTVMKGLPLAYNKDMQEDKEAVFDAVDNVKLSLEVFCGMFSTLTVKSETMRRAASAGYINATDCADYLVKKGLPFRDAYRVVGTLVGLYAADKKTLEELTLDEYNAACTALGLPALFCDDVYAAVSLETCVAGRKVTGGPAGEAVTAQLKLVSEFLQKNGL